MAKPVEKRQALALRRSGKSIYEISVAIGVSKGSVSAWCRNIELSEAQKRNLKTKEESGRSRGRMLGAQRNKDKKEKKIQDYQVHGQKTVKDLTKRELLIAGAALYWGEGGKTERWSFSNSDPESVKFMMRWLTVAMEVNAADITYRILINETHRARENQVLSFWSKYLGVSQSQFKSTTFVRTPQKKYYENHDKYYGVMMMRVKKSGDLLYRVLGLIQGLKNSTIGRVRPG